MFGGFAYLNVIGIRQAIALVKFTTIAKLTPIIMIAFLGWFFVSPENLTWTAGNSAPDLGEMSLILIFAFVGAETALNVSGEIKNPVRTIPRGIMMSMLVVVVLYILIQLTVQGILGQSISLFKDAPLAEAARRMIGPAGASIVIVGALFSMFGNISGMVLTMPRVLFAASRDNVLPPKALSKIHPRFSTPHISIISYASLGFIFASIGEFKQLAILSSASYLLIYLGVILSVIKFRITKKNQTGTYVVPGGYIIPAVSVLSILWLLSNIPFNELRAMIIFMSLLTTIYFVIKTLKKKD
jgi:amino acid transporter